MGYGMLFWLGLLAPVGAIVAAPDLGITMLCVGLVFVTVGLLASTLHLGHPARAWRAVSQWRTSWLSREGAAALIGFLPLGLFGLSWFVRSDPGGVGLIFGWLGAGMAVVTVVCTGMIYASLKPIRQWRNGFVVPLYLLFAASSGGAALAALETLTSPDAARLPALLAAGCGVVAWAMKLRYWRTIGRGVSATTAETATGLGGLGTVRLFEAPHTEENYLLREMGFRLGRRHRVRLRRVAIAVSLAALSGLFAAAAYAGPITAVLLWPSALLALLGVFVERWLFFAEATHTVVLYYGRSA
jgi:DMSO reductase anchor subunit